MAWSACFEIAIPHLLSLRTVNFKKAKRQTNPELRGQKLFKIISHHIPGCAYDLLFKVLYLQEKSLKSVKMYSEDKVQRNRPNAA